TAKYGSLSVFHERNERYLPGLHPFGSTLQENVSQVAMWRKPRTSPQSDSLGLVARRNPPPEAFVLFVYRTRKLRVHTAGECVTGRSVAKGSSAFRSRVDNTWGIAPGKVGHRQVKHKRDCLCRGSLFCVLL
ncbi:hypothetical protein ACPUYX_19980, partial [Desulfosporosinus sp. SYSU MS00001]|uniref:hypothetical protein n=1 Tax=Desulfosporosinus sp. SYSU MS00001 TaxID=3416284 RepID=UPI003CE875A0